MKQEIKCNGDILNTIQVKNSNEKFNRFPVKLQAKIMTSTIVQFYDEYVSYQNNEGMIAEKKSDTLLKTIIRPWRSELGFDFYKYKKEDFAKIDYNNLYFYSKGIDNSFNYTKTNETLSDEELET